ncbi:MAG TPA: hypothetical protein VN880_18860, partial [Solirubrobacteraceae bacterium]|nr:hypothetical protein [Solirubrobacteraceae bacterium]
PSAAEPQQPPAEPAPKNAAAEPAPPAAAERAPQQPAAEPALQQPAAEPAPQQPAAEPAPQPAAGPMAPLELDTLVQSWPAVVDYVRQGNAMIAATLAAARPAALSGGALTLAFPADAAFFKRKAEQDDARRAAAEAVKSVTGAKLALRYELSDEGPAAPDPESNLTGEELVRRFMEEFDAEEVLDDTDQEEAK